MNVDCKRNTHLTRRNKKLIFVKGNMGVPPRNGQRQMPLGSATNATGVFNQVYEFSTIPSSQPSTTRRTVLITIFPVR